MTRDKEKVLFQCRKCRTCLMIYPEHSLLSPHCNLLKLKDDCSSTKIEFIDKMPMEDHHAKHCLSFIQNVFYIEEVNIPQWINDALDKGDWTRGKLECPECSARLGSFDFVSGFHCDCKHSVVPPIHLVRSKVDFSFVM